ncbi:hypothetical protein ACHAP5_010148 [Fusarium lateritium]
MAPFAMEHDPQPKTVKGSGDMNNKSNAPSENGDIPSASSESSAIQDLGSMNKQNGGSVQTLTSSNKDEAYDSKIVTDDPFDNNRRRILFNAINELQSRGSQAYLDIPQASRFSSSNQVVGEQSAGKSSLLKSLTDIPFPVKSGIGTHFPIRIVSRPTAPGSRERFSIYVEKPPRDVQGLGRADPAAESYILEGDILTMSMFEEALQDLSENYIGIRKGSGQLKKNFVPDIVTVELSGPNRSLFNILDLPGLVNSSVNINKSELAGTHRLAIEYISKPKNTIICTLPATAELSTQKVIERCKEYVPDSKQLIGVFTKCDMVTSPKSLQTLISSTKTRAENSESAFENGMFVVCNEDDSENSVTGYQIEQRVFDKEPWSQIPAERRGTSKLRDHLGEILTCQIEEAFPQLEQEIQSQLSKRYVQLLQMGDHRITLSQNQAYLNQFVRKYSVQATLALRSPGQLESRDMDLRQKLGDLNTHFGKVMRWVGGVWAFGDGGIDPHTSCTRYQAVLDNTEIKGKEKNETAQKALYEMTYSPDNFQSALAKIQAFEKYKDLESSEDFGNIIKDNLGRFGASQPPGVVNSDIYPVIYRLQISKWGFIAQEHLARVRDALKLSYETILKSTCPDTGGTSVLYNELKNRLHLMFEETFLKARRDLESYCKQETERVFLQTNNPEFTIKLDGWRSLRYARAFHAGSTAKDGQAHDVISSQTLVNMWNSMDLSNETRMMLDIHDVVKVYYELSEKEISDITREDKNIGEMRNQLKRDIAKYEDARKIAKDARDRVEALKAA